MYFSKNDRDLEEDRVFVISPFSTRCSQQERNVRNMEGINRTVVFVSLCDCVHMAILCPDLIDSLSA